MEEKDQEKIEARNFLIENIIGLHKLSDGEFQVLCIAVASYGVKKKIQGMRLVEESIKKDFENIIEKN